MDNLGCTEKACYHCAQARGLKGATEVIKEPTEPKQRRPETPGNRIVVRVPHKAPEPFGPVEIVQSFILPPREQIGNMIFL